MVSIFISAEPAIQSLLSMYKTHLCVRSVTALAFETLLSARSTRYFVHIPPAMSILGHRSLFRFRGHRAQCVLRAYHNPERLEAVCVLAAFPRPPVHHSTVQSTGVGPGEPAAVGIGLVAAAEPVAGLAEEGTVADGDIVITVLR